MPDDGTCGVPKHVAELTTGEEYTYLANTLQLIKTCYEILLIGDGSFLT
jgi:hypothetical protein